MTRYSGAMRKFIAALVLLVCGIAPVGAAELRVMTVGLVGSKSFATLTAAWSQKTGNSVKLVMPPSALDQVLEAMKTQDADAVLLPTSDLAGQAAQFRPGDARHRRVEFGLGAKLNTPPPPTPHFH